MHKITHSTILRICRNSRGSSTRLPPNEAWKVLKWRFLMTTRRPGVSVLNLNRFLRLQKMWATQSSRDSRSLRLAPFTRAGGQSPPWILHPGSALRSLPSQGLGKVASLPDPSFLTQRLKMLRAPTSCEGRCPEGKGDSWCYHTV